LAYYCRNRRVVDVTISMVKTRILKHNTVVNKHKVAKQYVFVTRLIKNCIIIRNMANKYPQLQYN